MRLFIVEVNNIAELVVLIEALGFERLPSKAPAVPEVPAAPAVESEAYRRHDPQPANTNLPGDPTDPRSFDNLHRELYYRPPVSRSPDIRPDLEVWTEPKSWDDEPPFDPSFVRNIGEPTTHQHPLYQDGLNAWYGLLHTWNTNFGIEGEPQPDRAKALMDMLNYGGQAPWVYIRAFPGLTEAMFALVPNWGKKRVRQVTENIVQVASALAYREFADHLEYTPPYVNWARLSDPEPTA